MARPVDRVGWAKLLIIEPLSPSVGIIVQPDCLARPPNVDMVGQCKIAKAKIARHRFERFGKLVFVIDALDFTDKRLNPLEHAGTTAAGVFQVTSIRSRPFF